MCKVSVCMATYNGALYLKEQVDSIICQLGEEDELIVSDDGSTDRTIDILKSYNDSRIKIFKNTNKKGVVGNFENALVKAKGEYIFLSDQDDVWIDDKVKRCVEELEKVDLVVTDCYVTDSGLNIINDSFFRERGSRKGFIKNLIKNTYLGACVAFRSSVLEYVLPIPEKLPVYHDGWICSLADILGKVSFIQYRGLYYRRHEANVSFTAHKSKLSIYRQFRYRVIFLGMVINRLIKYNGNKK